MVQFILGRSGTGKTTLCIKQIIDCLLDKESGNNLVLLVPEQATYQAERSILSDNRIKGYSRLHILSFQRLCFMIFGKNLAARPLTRQGRDMIVHRLLCENAEKLEVFSSAAAASGTAVGIASVLAELQQHSKAPDDVDKLVEQLNRSQASQLTCSKLADIKLIYDKYLAFVRDSFFNGDSQLNLARDSVSRTPFLKDCRLWVDGFAGFTTSELLLLSELLKVSISSKIAFCLDPAVEENDFTGIFEPTEKTYAELLSLIKSLKLPVESPVILTEPRRFENSKALIHLEKNIFSFDKAPLVSSQDSIKITACAKARAEVDYVARQICSLVRDRNFRWRDIAVIASDLDSYRHYIQAVFVDFDIPFFIDRRRDLQQYPAVELLTSALRIATERFTTNDVINYLKSDLIPVSRADVDELENYCLAFGIEADDWLRTEAWDFAAEGDSDFNNGKIEAIRSKATGHLLRFRTFLRSSPVLSAERFCIELFNFLESLNVRGQLQDWTKTAFDEGRLDEAQLHQQFFAQFTQLMDDFVYIFKNSSLSARQYASIIASAFSGMTVALIPPALDQVLVGSIERSRHPDLKAVFLIGATQQQFPIPVYYDNIFNDNDRRIASDAGFELARTGSMQLVERRYLAYIAFTRPSRFLYITYPLTDEKGSDVQSSFLVSQLKSLFNDLAEEKYFGSSVSFAQFYNVSDLTCLFAWRLGKDNLSPIDNLDAKCKWLLDAASKEFHLAAVKSAIDYKNSAWLDEKPAEKVFAAGLVSSATRLQSFACCPFKHFAKYILELKEKRIFELKPLDLGLFFHKVLQLLFHNLKSKNLTLSAVQPGLLAQLVDKSVEKLLVEDSFLKSFSARTRHNSFIILSAAEVIKDAALEFSQIASAGDFVQIASEIGFGDKLALSAVEVGLSDGKKLHIEGKIDRVDAAFKDGKNYALVIDYKTSGAAIDFSLLAAGLDLQLPIYLLAVRNQSIDKYDNLIPLGAFYFPIQASPGSANLSEVEKTAEKIKRKPKGIFNGEFFKLIDNLTNTGASSFYSFQITKDNMPFGDYERRSVLRPEHFSKLLSFTENKLKKIGGRILSGIIDANPYRYAKKIACTYCPYKSLCRFDWQINNYADVRKISKTDFFQAID
jgi:ATP-dependent helicase/nuclease subunit B